MSDVAIRVENISKRYRIGTPQKRYDTLRDALMSAFQRSNDSAFQQSNVDTIWALKDVSFEVKRGEVVGVIGRNGAGKSTLLKILSRITDPTEGHAEIRGRVGSLLEVGTGFHPELTGRENIFLNGAILGMRKTDIERKFDEIVGFAEVEKFIDTPVKHYSSGMYVRLAFAVAAHMEPEILLVDEVLAVGDVAFQKKCLGKMGDVAKEGRTVLFVSHNMAAVENLCDRSLLLVGGMVQFAGNTKDVITTYLQGLLTLQQMTLRDRSDRKGNGKIRICDIVLHNFRNKATDRLISGKDAYIVLKYESGTDDLQNVDVALSVDNSTGQRIFTLYTEFTGNTFEKPAQKGTFICYIPDLPLCAGQYYFTIFVNKGSEIYDWVTNAGSFIVEDGDFFGTGRVQDSGRGYFLVKHRWYAE